MNNVKLFRCPIGSEHKMAEEIAAFYNRQGRIGNHVGNTSILVYQDGSIGASVPYSGDIIDDGRQIDDIEDRKNILISRVSGTDTAEIEKFYADHNAEDYEVSRIYSTAAGNDTVYFLAAAKIIRVTNVWNGDYSGNDDDWTPSGTPTAEASTAKPDDFDAFA